MTLLSVDETASILNVSPSTVRRYIAAGRLPAARKGRALRITKDAAEQFLSRVPARHSGSTAIGLAKNGHFAPQRISDAEVASALAALDDARAFRQDLRSRRGGEPFDESWPMIRRACAERSTRA